MARMIQGLTGQVIHRVMDERKARLPNLGDDPLAISSSVREEKDETYTYTPPVRMSNDPLVAQPSHQDAPGSGVMGLAPVTEVVNSLQRKIDALTEKEGHSLMTIKQRGRELISSFQDRFQMELNLVPGADQKIFVIAFVEGLRMRKFKESLLMKMPLNLEEVNGRAYRYIRIEEVEKRAEEGSGKRPMEEARRRSPEPKRHSALEKI
ncbi:hypothetical protein LIER_10515 [Lithospermum erythrorhizon]|uniref:Uncharacterized protein n=1 Tax=Lithospermum erythrorhizon TaxID=34254 RepID=A0AAV3PKT6_LITER